MDQQLAAVEPVLRQDLEAIRFTIRELFPTLSPEALDAAAAHTVGDLCARFLLEDAPANERARVEQGAGGQSG